MNRLIVLFILLCMIFSGCHVGIETEIDPQTNKIKKIIYERWFTDQSIEDFSWVIKPDGSFGISFGSQKSDSTESIDALMEFVRIYNQVHGVP